MKYVVTTIAALVLFSFSIAAADERLPRKDDKSGQVQEAEDCSKQVWPHFSPSCLRTPDKGTNARLVTTDRRG
jgi:hypothetical protein